MSTLVATDKLSVYPYGTLVINCPEAENQTVASILFLRCSNILDHALIPKYLMRFVEIDS
jgi:hypothetical protein